MSPIVSAVIILAACVASASLAKSKGKDVSIAVVVTLLTCGLALLYYLFCESESFPVLTPEEATQVAEASRSQSEAFNYQTYERKRHLELMKVRNKANKQLTSWLAKISSCARESSKTVWIHCDDLTLAEVGADLLKEHGYDAKQQSTGYNDIEFYIVVTLLKK